MCHMSCYACHCSRLSRPRVVNKDAYPAVPGDCNKPSADFDHAVHAFAAASAGAVQSTLRAPGQGQVRLQIPDMLASASQVSPDKDLPQVDKNCLLVFIKFYDPKTENLKVTAMSCSARHTPLDVPVFRRHAVLHAIRASASPRQKQCRLVWCACFGLQCGGLILALRTAPCGCRSGSLQDSPSQRLLQHCTSALQINKSSLNASHCCMQHVGHIIAPAGMTCGALTPLHETLAGLPDESRSIGRGIC